VGSLARRFAGEFASTEESEIKVKTFPRIMLAEFLYIAPIPCLLASLAEWLSHKSFLISWLGVDCRWSPQS